MRIKQLSIKTIALFAIVLLTVLPNYAANKPTLKRVEPPFWWTGFKNPSLQLMIYGERISETKPEINYEGVDLVAVQFIGRDVFPHHTGLMVTIASRALATTVETADAYRARANLAQRPLSPGFEARMQLGPDHASSLMYAIPVTG